ncbi:MAG: A24 family peptidase [Lachnospiraceae bacterium]|nr:A24 family peptidase [Lachnospiraceae bacterium]
MEMIHAKLLEMLLICSLVICLAAAGLWDFQAGRIPNRWLAFWYAAGAGYFVCSGWLAAAGYLVRCAAAAGLFFLFFLCRMIGAGDIKCMALICGYLGFASGFRVIGIGMIIGAVWSFAKLIHGNLFWERMSRLTAYVRQVFHEKKLIRYYVPERDGREVTLPLAFCLFWGLAVFVFFRILIEMWMKG